MVSSIGFQGFRVNNSTGNHVCNGAFITGAPAQSHFSTFSKESNKAHIFNTEREITLQKDKHFLKNK